MQDDASSQPVLRVGDIVLHRSKGVAGRIVRITADPEPRVFVRIRDGNEYDLSLSLATTALTKLPPDGLLARVLNDWDSLVAWEKSAPLRLIAVALVDLGRSGRPGQIGSKLVANRLLSAKWESWWKKVQPVLKQSPHFRVRPDGAYELLSSPDAVTAEPLPSISRKKETALSQSQALELLRRLHTGEISFEAIEGAKAKHRLARELVKRGRKELQAREIMIAALKGSARPAGIMLEEIVKKGDLQQAGKALEALLTHIAELALTAAADKESHAAEHLIAKLHIFRENLVKAISRSDAARMESLSTIARQLLSLATSFAGADATTWRTKANGNVLQSLSSIIVAQPSLATGIGGNLAVAQRELDTRLSIAEELLTNVSVEQRVGLLRSLVAGIAERSVDLADMLVERLETRDSHIPWWVKNFKDVQPAQTSDSATVAQALLERIGSRISPQELDQYMQLVVLVSLVNSSVVLPGVAQDKVSEWADGLSLSETSDHQFSSEAALSPLLVAIRARVQIEQRNWDSAKNSLLADISGLEDKAREHRETVARQEGVIAELKSGFRTPEKWVEYRAKKEVLERLGTLYQEVFEICGKERDNGILRRILNQVETILLRNGATVFGAVDGLAIFNPSQHEFIRGGESSEREVRVQTPGFLWKDPAGNSIVLVRVRVTRK